MTAAAEVSAAGSLTVKLSRGPVEGVENRLARLEQITADLDRRIDATKAELDASMSSASEKNRAELAEVHEALRARERAVREHREATVGIEWFGWCLFVVGVILQTFGNVL